MTAVTLSIKLKDGYSAEEVVDNTKQDYSSIYRTLCTKYNASSLYITFKDDVPDVEGNIDSHQQHTKNHLIENHALEKHSDSYHSFHETYNKHTQFIPSAWDYNYSTSISKWDNVTLTSAKSYVRRAYLGNIGKNLSYFRYYFYLKSPPAVRV